MKLPLTAIILTHRADSTFLQALQSVQDCAEVLVYDNTSQNNWDQLHTQYSFTVKKIAAGQITNFAAIRNKALKTASQDWVFFLDSDEVLQPFDPKKVRSLLENNSAGYTITRSDIFLGRQLHHGEAGNQKIIRLMKRDFAHFEHAIHEVAIIDGQTSDSSLKVHHFSHTSITQFMRDITIYAKEIARTRTPFTTSILVELILYPPIKFLYTFFFLFGFLDGYRGLVYSCMMSLHSLLVRIYTYEQTTT